MKNSNDTGTFRLVAQCLDYNWSIEFPYYFLRLYKI